MIDWKALFGDAESLTLDEFEAKVAGKKLVDLTEGEYVSKEKFDKAEKAKKDAIAELTDLKAATDGDDGLKRQLDTANNQLAEAVKRAEAAEGKAAKAERMEAIRTKAPHLSAKLARTLYDDALALMSDDTDFAEAIEKAIEADADYAPASDDGGKQPPVRMKSGNPGQGAPDTPDPNAAAFAKGLGITDE